jgi:hypothetical protein
MPFERAIERINSGGAKLDFSFDQQHWLRALEPVDRQDGVASFDGTSAALPEQPQIALPEAGGPTGVGQTGPFTMTGLRWADDPLGAPAAKANAFTATLRGARAVTLDAAGMGLSFDRPLTARITTEHALTMTLRAGARTVVRQVPAGTHEVVVAPAG